MTQCGVGAGKIVGPAAGTPGIPGAKPAPSTPPTIPWDASSGTNNPEMLEKGWKNEAVKPDLEGERDAIRG